MTPKITININYCAANSTHTNIFITKQRGILMIITVLVSINWSQGVYNYLL